MESREALDRAEVAKGAALEELQKHPSFSVLTELITTELAQVFERFLTARSPDDAWALSHQGRALSGVLERIDDAIEGARALGQEIASRGEQDAADARFRERARRFEKDPIGEATLRSRRMGL